MFASSGDSFLTNSTSRPSGIGSFEFQQSSQLIVDGQNRMTNMERELMILKTIYEQDLRGFEQDLRNQENKYEQALTTAKTNFERMLNDTKSELNATKMDLDKTKQDLNATKVILFEQF